MIGKGLAAALGIQEQCRCLLQAANKNSSFRTHDLRAHIVGVNRLHVGFNISNRAFPIFQVHYAGDHIAVLRHFRADRNRRIGVGFDDLVAHQPASQVEIMNRIVVKQHPVHVRLVGC